MPLSGAAPSHPGAAPDPAVTRLSEMVGPVRAPRYMGPDGHELGAHVREVLRIYHHFSPDSALDHGETDTSPTSEVSDGRVVMDTAQAREDRIERGGEPARHHLIAHQVADLYIP